MAAEDGVGCGVRLRLFDKASNSPFSKALVIVSQRHQWVSPTYQEVENRACASCGVDVTPHNSTVKSLFVHLHVNVKMGVLCVLLCPPHM